MPYPTSLTLVKPLARLRCERWLPVPGEVVAQVGQAVTAVQVVARAPIARGFLILRASEALRVPPADVGRYLLVEEGVAVRRGQPLLRRPGLLGSQRPLASPIDGLFHQLRHGRLILQRMPDTLELRAMVQGWVTNVTADQWVTIETDGALIQAVWSSGKEGFGRLLTPVTAPDGVLTAAHLGPESRGAILVAGRVDEMAALRKAEESSVRGLIVGSLPPELFAAAPGLAFPVVLTEGVGPLPMAEPLFRVLLEHQGEEASLLNPPPGPMGGRPSIVIPRPGATAAVLPEDDRPQWAIGQVARILQPPHAGQVGRVVQLLPRGRMTAAGRWPGAEVALADGQRVFVPYLNLDLLPGAEA
ncbi:MAG: hypothetical protein AB1791_14950 [Chloroflexota bacterium]